MFVRDTADFHGNTRNLINLFIIGGIIDRNMKRKVMFIFVLFINLSLVLILPAFAENITITTGYLSNQGVTDNIGSQLWGTDEAGCLVQIIKVGSGGPYPSDKYGNPTPPDTLMLPASYIGEGFLYELEPANGRFATASSYLVNPGEHIIVRVWNSIEASQSTYYGDSPVLTVEAYMTDWNIKGTDNFPAFSTTQYFDNIPPDPPSNFIATPDASGDIILTWTKSSSPDAIGTRIVWRTDRSPTMEWDYLDGNFTNVLIAAAQAYRHTNLTQGITYDYGAFSYDSTANFSTPAATTSEVSNDTLPPNVVGYAPTGTSAPPTTTKIVVTFDDRMNRASVEGAIVGLSFSSFNWSTNDKTVSCEISGSLAAGTWYYITVETSAADKALNQLGSPFSWSFRTAAGQPPRILDFKIDGWKQYAGEIISPHPKLSATITDEDSGFAGISTVEMQANSALYSFTASELDAVYNRTNGYFDARFPVFLPEGTYTITLRAFDSSGNSTEESVAGLKISGGAAEVIQKEVYSYPSEFESGKGTILAYKLNVTSDIQIYVYSAGGLVFKKKIAAGEPGGIAGYNEVAWDGLSSLGNKLSNGLYVVIIANGDKRLAKLYVKINNPPER